MAKNSNKKFSRGFPFTLLGLALPLLLTCNTKAQESTDAAIKSYIEKFQNDDWRVYQDAYRDLARIGTPAVPVLIEALKDPEPKVRVYAADVLAGMESDAKEAVHALSEALSDKDEYVRASAAEALEAIGPAAKEAIPDLIKALKDKNNYVRYNAADALDEFDAEAKQAVPALIETLEEDKDEYVRYSAADTLADIGPDAKEAVPVLIEAIANSSDEHVRSAAARALGAIATAAKVEDKDNAVEQLIKTLKDDKDEYVRSSAAEALGAMNWQPKSTVPALMDALDDRDARVRSEAATSLGKMGEGAKAAVPKLIEALEDGQEVRSSAVRGLAGIGDSFVDSAQKLSGSQLRSIISHLQSAVKVLEDPKADFTKAEIALIRRRLVALKAEEESRFSNVLSAWIVKNKFLSGLLIYLAFFPTLWGLLLWLQPMWLLAINNALEPYSEFQLTGFMRGTKLSLRAILLLTFFAYKPRVLDAWVATYIKQAIEEFQQKDTVREFNCQLSIPVSLDGKTFAPITSRELQSKFNQKQCYMLIAGEGGVGKTSLACQIAKWAMSENKEERLCDRLMLPVLIEEELDIKTDTKKTDKKSDKSPKSPFLDAIRGQLQDLIDEVKPISEELLERLLQQRRILVIVDRFSELSEATRAEIRPDSADFPVNTLVVTSRNEEKLGRVNKIVLKPQRIQGNLLSSCIEAYLTEQGKRTLFSDMEFLDACRDLSLRVGERTCTLLLVKMYAEAMMAAKESFASGGFTETLPDVMLVYLNKLNEDVAGKLDNRTVQKDAKVVAWECIKANYRLAPLQRKDAIAALGEKSEDRLKYLEDRLRLVQTIGAAQDQIRFDLEPLAEYLAAMQVVELYGEKEESWREFLDKASVMIKSQQASQGFLLAVFDCCAGSRVKVPSFVAAELSVLTGLTPAPEPAELEQSVSPGDVSAEPAPNVAIAAEAAIAAIAAEAANVAIAAEAAIAAIAAGPESDGAIAAVPEIPVVSYRVPEIPLVSSAMPETNGAIASEPTLDGAIASEPTLDGAIAAEPEPAKPTAT